MTLTGIVPERGTKTFPHWIAIWKLPAGVIHDSLPLTVNGTTKAEATVYAQANPPKWTTDDKKEGFKCL